MVFPESAYSFEKKRFLSIIFFSHSLQDFFVLVDRENKLDSERGRIFDDYRLALRKTPIMHVWRFTSRLSDGTQDGLFTLSNFLKVILKPICFKMSQT